MTRAHACHSEFIACLVLLLISLSCTTYCEKDLQGTWTGKDAGRHLTMTFNLDASWNCSIKTAGEKPIVLTGTYEVIFSKHPVPLTIRNIPQLTHPLHTIVDFITRDQIRIAAFAPRWRTRPVNFNSSGNLVLYRTAATSASTTVGN